MADSMASAVSLIILYFSSAFLVKTIKSFSVHFHTHVTGGLLSSSAHVRGRANSLRRYPCFPTAADDRLMSLF